MPEPFKNLFNNDLIEAMSNVFVKASGTFDATRFIETATDGLDDLEMMARADQISCALEFGLNGNFLENLDILEAALHPNKTSELADMATDAQGIAGWAIVPMASYVARCGMQYPQQSLDTLREMTKRFSTEFAVRFFIRDHLDISLENARTWATDKNFHVRRLSSEGFRPLLPWGIKLHQFVADPSPLLPLLEQLRDDPSDYVRKSVANNLNDISKNHPDLVAELAFDWMKDASNDRIKLVRHACRTLIKAGHPKAFAVFGFQPPEISDVWLKIPDQVTLGDAMPVEFGFRAQNDQRYLIDYALHFMRANGKLSPKVFKWTERSAKIGEQVTLVKTHPYKLVTTRKDYPGLQYLTVHMNGIEVARAAFEFRL